MIPPTLAAYYREPESMTNAPDTGEHFLGPLEADDESAAQSTARRVADLSTQIDFLDREIARYRELLERERIRHSTEFANLQLETDHRLDEIRRNERLQTQNLHDSYRKLLSERQVEFEAAISEAAAASAAELSEERRRYEETLSHERTRREAQIEASRQQVVDELSAAHKRSNHSLQSELRQATSTIARLESELAEYVERARLAEIQVHNDAVLIERLEQRVDIAEAHQRKASADVEARLELAERRLEAERRRSAATLAELLERSASVAAEADQARSNYAAEQVKTAHAAASARVRAEADYASLSEAADERAARALVREGDLEAVIAELRAHLNRKRNEI